MRQNRKGNAVKKTSFRLFSERKSTNYLDCTVNLFMIGLRCANTCTENCWTDAALRRTQLSRSSQTLSPPLTEKKQNKLKQKLWQSKNSRRKASGRVNFLLRGKRTDPGCATGMVLCFVRCVGMQTVWMRPYTHQ